MAALGRSAITLASLVLAIAAMPAVAGDRLAWTGAVAQVEGSAGGGLVPWALISGLGTDEQFGASGYLSYASTQDFSLRTAGVSFGIANRTEVSLARQRLDAGSVMHGLTLGQDIAAIKVRLLGDAIFAPVQTLPQIAVGAQWKRTLDFEQVPRAVGAARGEDVDLYIAATKMYFALLEGRNVVLDATLRRTRANQFGLLGFGGNGRGSRFVPEFSAAIFLNDGLLLGAEYRDKPNNLAAFREGSAEDVFLAWAPSKNVTLIGAWADLGSIAGKPSQRGLYVSLWLGI